MTLKFRNLNVTPNDPVKQWGGEGILTALERGGSKDWARINQAIKQDPYGEVAEDLEIALDLCQSRGITALMQQALELAREPESAKTARKIKYWVETSGMTRASIAKYLGTSRTRLSSYENGSVTPSAVISEKLRALSEKRRADLIQ